MVSAAQILTQIFGIVRIALVHRTAGKSQSVANICKIVWSRGAKASFLFLKNEFVMDRISLLGGTASLSLGSGDLGLEFGNSGYGLDIPDARFIIRTRVYPKALEREKNCTLDIFTQNIQYTLLRSSRPHFDLMTRCPPGDLGKSSRQAFQTSYSLY